MAELLQWFHNLEPAERSSAMAIVDDRHFLSFYIDLMRHEHTERELSNSNSSALFMKDYLLTLYERSKAGKHYRSDQGSATFQEHTSNESSEDISSNHSALLLSFLNSDRLRGTDSSDFTDPFQLPCLLPGNSILKSNVTLSKLSATNDVCSRGSVKPFGDTTSSNLKLGLQSAITALFDTAVLNVVQKLGSQGQHSSATTGLVLPRATAAEPVLSDLLGHEINNKDISIELHKGIAVSFATGGSGGLDCLFFMRPLTEDSYKLVQMFSDLSNGRMFNQSPSKAQVKSAVSSRSLFLAGWLDDVLTTGSNKGSSAVPYYLLLLSRVELSMWSAYYSCSSNSINISGLGSVTDGYEDIPTANYKSVPLLPRSSKHDRRTAPSSVLPPIRNSLRVLERSALYFHASTSVMLTLGCIIEEQKLQWRSLSTENRLRILDCFPKAKAFYSNSENPRGRPESIVDRLILCPIDWIAAEAAVGAEADVVRAFRSLEAIAHSASNGYGSSSYSSSTILGGSSNEDSKNSLVRHPESKSLSHVDIMSGVSDGNRPVFIKFNKEAKRTGAVHILSEMSGNDSTSSTTGVEQIDRSVVTTRSTGTPLGLSARKRTQPTPTTPIPARHTAIVQSESSKVESSNEEEKIVVGTEEENQTAQVMAKATTSFKIKLDEDKDKDKRSDLDPIAVPAITPAAETSVMTASKIKRNKKKIKSIAQAAAKELSSMAENTISEEIIHASHIDASICADVSGGNRVSDSGRHMELEDVCVGSMSLSQKNEDNSPEFVELADTAMPFILRNGISSPVLDKVQQLQHPLGVIDSHPANQPDTVYSPPADIALNLLTDLQYAGDQAVASKIISASLSAEGVVLLDRQREESVQLVLSRNEKDSRQANYLEGDSTNLVLPTAGDSLPPDAAVHATGECSSHPEEASISLPAESLVVVSGSGVRVKSRELRIEVPLGLTVGNENEDLHPAITFGSFDSIEIKHTHPSAQLIPEGGVTPRSLVVVAVAGGPVNVTGSTIESTPSLSVKSIHSSYPASPVNPSALLARQLGRARAVTSIEDVSTERSGSINVLTDRDDRLPIRPPLPAALTRRLNRSYSQSSFAGEFTAPNVRGKPGSRFEAAENYVGDIRFVDEAVDHDFRCSSGSYSAFGDSNGNITDYPYNDSIQNIPDQRAGKSLRRTAAYRDGSSGSGRGVREQTEWKAKTALSRLQKILTRNIRSFNNVSNPPFPPYYCPLCPCT